MCDFTNSVFEMVSSGTNRCFSIKTKFGSRREGKEDAKERFLPAVDMTCSHSTVNADTPSVCSGVVHFLLQSFDTNIFILKMLIIIAIAYSEKFYFSPINPLFYSV